MTAYLLHYTDFVKDLEVLKFSEPKLADIYSYDKLPNVRTAKIVSGEDSFRDRTSFSIGLITAIHNALGPERPVAQFDSHDIAARRTFSLLDEKFNHLEVTPVALAVNPPMNVPTSQETIEMPKPKRANAAGVNRKTNKKSAGTVAEFRPTREGTDRAKILKLMDGALTPEEIGREMGGGKFDAKYIMAHAYCLRRDCGIGYELTKDGKLVADYPRGKSYDDAIKPPVEKKQPANPRRERANAEAAA